MEAWDTGRRAVRATRLPLVAVAMLVSGCFHAGPSVKQSMTSAAAPHGHGTVAEGSAHGAGTAVGKSGAGAATLGSTTHFDLHKPEVESRVLDFQTNLRDFFDGALERGAKYVPTMTAILAEEGLPSELAYLPLIESGYRPQAVSRAGAVGPWQFIRETGQRYGLRIDSLVDERRDPIKSTQAAVQYLKELHGMFGDWELSLAAYNTGEYRVARILARTQADDFWDMRERGYLPEETSDYVPRFLAAVRIASAPESYGFETPIHTPMSFETVHVDRQLSLRTAADLCGVSASELAELNPALRKGITPTGYALRVPAGRAESLRVGLASYTEPVRPVRGVARASRAGRRTTEITKAPERSSRLAAERAVNRPRTAGTATYRRGRPEASQASKSRPRSRTKTASARPSAPARGAKPAKGRRPS